MYNDSRAGVHLRRLQRQKYWFYAANAIALISPYEYNQQGADDGDDDDGVEHDSVEMMTMLTTTMTAWYLLSPLLLLLLPTSAQ